MSNKLSHYIKILIVDDNELFRSTLLSFLKEDDNLLVIDKVENGQLALSVVKTSPPDIMLLDVEMPVLDGIQTMEELNKMKMNTRVIVLSSYYNIELRNEFQSLGAYGFISKAHSPETLMEAIYKVYNGGYYFHQPGAVDSEMKERGKNRLKTNFHITNREIEIILAVCNGLTNKEIAEKCSIVERTVEAHKTSIYHKLAIASSAELVRIAIETELIEKRFYGKIA